MAECQWNVPEIRCGGDLDEFIVRDHRSGDMPRILGIAVASREPIYSSRRESMGAELFDRVFPHWQAEKRANVRRVCDGASAGKALVAEMVGTIVGFITFRADRASGVGEITMNAVHPDSQGNGVSTMMCERVFEELRALDMRSVKVSTGGGPAHAAARRTYEKAGFTIALPVVDYYCCLWVAQAVGS